MPDIFDQIKESISFETVAQYHGIVFNRNTIRCPFHDDRNPSFSIHPSRTYATCFGECSKVFDAIEIEYVKGEHSNRWEAGISLINRHSLNIQFNGYDKEKAKEFEDASTLLKWYCEQTHKALLQNMEALKWLESKKGISLEIIKKYRIGFVGKGWLREKVKERSREVAVKLGLLREKDGKVYDAFWNRLIFPVWNSGRIVNIWTREWPGREGSNSKWLGLETGEFTPYKPIPFVENLTCEKCVIAESIPDALAFIQAEIQAVALLGKDISSANKKYFDKARAKLYFALDPDEQGREASYRLGREYQGYIVDLGHDKDPDEILAEHGLDGFKAMVEKGIDEAKYYLDAVIQKQDKIEALKEIAKLEFESDKETWIKKLSEKHNVGKRTLQRDLKTISNEAKTKLEDQEPYDPLSDYTDDEIEKARQLLTTNDMLDKMVLLTDRAGYTREERNKKLTYLACTSRKLPGRKKSISLITKGESGSGKSELVKYILNLIPPKDIEDYTFITEKALVHAKDMDLSHKVLCVFERAGSQKADYSIRTAISEEKLSIFIPVKNPDTGNFESVKKETPARGMVYIETTTEENIEPQNANRTFEFFTDSSPELTREVLLTMSDQYDRNETEIQAEYRVWRCAQELLESSPVYVPFARQLALEFPVDQVRARRDFPRLLALIEASAFLHQANRDRIERNGIEYIVASEKDFSIALEIIRPILEQTYKNLTPKEEDLIQIIKEEIGFGSFIDPDDPESMNRNMFGVSSFLEKIKPRLNSRKDEDKAVKQFQNYSTVKKYFKSLSKKGFLTWNNKKGTESKYILLSDSQKISFGISLSQYANIPQDEKNDNHCNRLEGATLDKNEFGQYLANMPMGETLDKNQDIGHTLAKTRNSQCFKPNLPNTLENKDIGTLDRENEKKIFSEGDELGKNETGLCTGCWKIRIACICN